MELLHLAICHRAQPRHLKNISSPQHIPKLYQSIGFGDQYFQADRSPSFSLWTPHHVLNLTPKQCQSIGFWGLTKTLFPRTHYIYQSAPLEKHIHTICKIMSKYRFWSTFSPHPNSNYFLLGLPLFSLPSSASTYPLLYEPRIQPLLINVGPLLPNTFTKLSHIILFIYTLLILPIENFNILNSAFNSWVQYYFSTKLNGTYGF